MEVQKEIHIKLKNNSVQLLELNNAVIFQKENEASTVNITLDLLHGVLNNTAISNFIEVSIIFPFK